MDNPTQIRETTTNSACHRCSSQSGTNFIRPVWCNKFNRPAGWTDSQTGPGIDWCEIDATPISNTTRPSQCKSSKQTDRKSGDGRAKNVLFIVRQAVGRSIGNSVLNSLLQTSLLGLPNGLLRSPVCTLHIEDSERERKCRRLT